MRRSRSPLLLAALLFCAPFPVSAADRGTTDKLRDLEAEIGDVTRNVEGLRVNFTERSGLIGVGEARQRYEDAVYAFLVGDFASAATSFYILVESRALGNADLARDAEWYLAECIFELGNHRTSEDAYRRIMDAGPKHPYFADAVRKILEVYGIIGDDAKFNEVYAAWIVTGKVPATDLVNYTLAKSFYRRGQSARAKAMFDSITTQSPYYTRARYFYGVLMIQEKNLQQAITEFGNIESAPVASPEQKAVFDLAIMALARLHYEVGDFEKSSAYYARIEKLSPQFADQLYESVWTFIKQEKFADAVKQVDIFLLGYPDHRHTAVLKILQGHLNMKLKAFDNARASYERVVEEYTPIAGRLGEVSLTTADSRNFLARMSGTGTGSGLPQYVEGMLLSREDVGRAELAFRTLQEEQSALREAEELVKALEVALSGSADALSTFVNARNELANARGAVLAMNGRMLDAEGNYLRSRVPGAIRAEVLAIGTERSKAEAKAADIKGSTEISSDRLQIYDEQVREVQQGAVRVTQIAQEQIAGARNTIEVLQGGQTRLSAAEREEILKQIEAERSTLANAVVELDRLQSEVERRRIMRAVEEESVEDNSGERKSLLANYRELRRKLQGYRRHATDSDAAATFAQIDRLWAQIDALEGSSEEAARVIASGEAREIGQVRQRLSATGQRVVELRRDFSSGGADAEAVAVRVIHAGLRDLQADFAGDVLLADKGIVDVYWLRKTGTSEEMDQLTQEQARLLQELDEKFRVIKENLEQ